MILITRRTPRYLAAITGSFALLLGFATLVAPPAIAVDESEVVGPPQHYLIESVHAAGKVLEIGNETAQLTAPDNATPAAAAIFSRATTPTALAAQAVTAYPVTGATATYVFTNTDGDVLVRNANDSSYFRYLTLSDMSIDEAAADSYAQWAVKDAGSGQVYLQNGQKDGNGYTPALDMYNWATADKSEIQTYDAGGAAVQKWIMRSLTPTVAAIAGRTQVGVAPTLPTSVNASYSWGQTFPVTPIVWDTPESSAWAVDGTVTITGTGTGYFGEEILIAANYLVGSLGAAVDSPISGHVGITVKQLRMIAPTRVDRTVSGSETTVSAPVVWDWSAVSDASTAEAGTFTVFATESTGFSAKLIVTIAAAETANIARAGGVHTKYYYGDGTGLSDGVRNKLGFSDWRSGGAANRVNPNKVTYYFDEPQQISGAAVFDGGTDSKLNIGKVTVQYRNLTGGWVDLPVVDLEWPYVNSTSELSLTVASDMVLATGARVVIESKSTATWMSLSEFEVYGPNAISTRTP